MSRRLIEQWLPAETIGAESLRERGSAKAFPPINFLHVWWARRPLLASRAAIVASLLPAWPDEEEIENDPHAPKILAALKSEFPKGFEQYQSWFTKAIGIFGDPVAGRVAIKEAVAAGTRTASNAYGYERAFTVQASDETLATFRKLAALTTDSAEPPVVVDPFAGGGSIPFEAMRYGCEAVANELNPVACAILQGTLVLPSQFGASFAATIGIWGGRWSERVRKRLDDYFPLADSDERLAYIWAHTVPCPTTGLPTPLAPDFWLARGAAGKDVAVRLEVNLQAGIVRPLIVEGDAAAEFGRRSTYKGGAAESIWTGETFSGAYIRQQAEAKRLGYMLLAISSTRPGIHGRMFRAPTQRDLTAIEAAENEVHKCLPSWQVADLIPDEYIDAISNYDRGHRMYGIERWSDFFTPRQLLSNVARSRGIAEDHP